MGHAGLQIQASKTFQRPPWDIAAMNFSGAAPGRVQGSWNDAG